MPSAIPVASAKALPTCSARAFAALSTTDCFVRGRFPVTYEGEPKRAAIEAGVSGSCTLVVAVGCSEVSSALPDMSQPRTVTVET